MLSSGVVNAEIHLAGESMTGQWPIVPRVSVSSCLSCCSGILDNFNFVFAPSRQGNLILMKVVW